MAFKESQFVIRLFHHREEKCIAALKSLWYGWRRQSVNNL